MRKIVLVVLLVIPAVCMQAQESRVDEIRLALMENKYEKALRLCQRGIAAGEDETGFLSYQAALINRSLQRHGEAARDIEAALEADPDNLDYLEERGRIEQASGDSFSARKTYAQVFGQDSSRLQAGNQLARYYVGLQNYSTACQIYEVLVREAPENGYYHRMKGFCLVRLKRPRSAMEEMRLAIRMDSSDLVAYEYMNTLYLAAEELDSALSLLQRAVHFIPNHPSIYTMMGEVQMHRNHYYQAIPLLQRAEELSRPLPDLTLLNDLASAYETTAQWAKARDYYLRMLDRYEDFNTFQSLGAVYKRLNKPDSVLYCYEKVLEISLPTAHSNSFKLQQAAEINAELGNIERAVQIYKVYPGYSMKPRLRDLYTLESLERIAHVYKQYGKDYEKALAYYKEALDYLEARPGLYKSTRERIEAQIRDVEEELFFQGKLKQD